MYNDFYGVDEFPFHGVFYRIGIDETKPLEERSEEEIEILDTPCDMYDGSGLNTDTFTIFFPFDIRNENITINEGDMIKANVAGMEQRGKIIGIYPSQLGGCKIVLTRM